MAAVRIHILETRDGSPDGITVVRYRPGETHDMPVDLAAVFLREGWGKVVPKRKDTGPAPENKAIEAPPENKGLSAARLPSRKSRTRVTARPKPKL